MRENLSSLQRIVDGGGRIVFLTGAGISAESGIPTFRGPEGYWTSGSEVYHPQELATWRMFSSQPDLVWPWYLWRQSVCKTADPNPAHHALVTLEDRLGDRFTLVTQNVDGLHHRAGNTLARTFEIHGNINFFRCANGCSPPRPMPELDGVGPESGFLSEWGETLECARCRCWMRPHVLWFDEYYNEQHYRFESAVEAMNSADALIVAGTTGTTSLPAHMLQIAQMKRLVIVDINPNDNPFARAALNGPGTWLNTSATEGMALLLDELQTD
jgi:NAD-dependent deacetylase